MGVAASELIEHVIRPTLLELNRHSVAAENLLLGVAACQSHLCFCLDNPNGHGIYCISEASHLTLWDHFLAREPELASQVRGLASQHAFLTAPHLELTVNLRYATAIAWMLIEAHLHPLPLPEQQSVQEMAQLWRKVFRPEGRIRDFVSAWHKHVEQVCKAA